MQYAELLDLRHVEPGMWSSKFFRWVALGHSSPDIYGVAFGKGIPGETESNFCLKICFYFVK